MDRQSLIGMGLIFTIFVGWYFLVSRYHEPKPEIQTTRSKATRTDSTKMERAISVQSKAIAPVPSVPFYRAGEEKKLEIETDLFKAVLSTKGATLLSFIQKKHVAYNGKPFELITDKNGATSMLFKMKNGDVVSTRDVYFRTNAIESRMLSGDSTSTFLFEALLDSLSQTLLKIEYSFKGDSYAIGYRIDITSNGQSAIVGNDYQLVWSGGLGFSEKNKTDEVSFSYAHALLGDELAKLDAENTKDVHKLEPDGSTKWITVQSKFFLAAIVPSSPADGVYIEGIRTGEKESVVETYIAALKEYNVQESGSINKSYLLYVGPLDYEAIKQLKVDLERTMDFGWEWLTRPFAEYIIIPMFEMLEKFVSNYGLILILFAVAIKIVTYPLSLSQTKSMKKMVVIQPKLKKLQEQHKNDPMRLRTEMSKLYRESGANPLSGCLPMILQLPILIALFNVFRSSIQLRQKGFLWIDDLSSPDIILNLPFSIPLYGDHITILPILMAASMVVQMKLTPMAPQTEQSGLQMKIFQYIFPLMMLLIFNSTPSGLSLYYFTFNVLSIAQQFLTNKFMPASAAPLGMEVKAQKTKNKK